MSIPTPASVRKFQQKKASSSPETSETTDPSPQKSPEKKPFVRKPHLTDRPLRGNSDLEALRKNLTRRPQKKQEKK